MDWDDFFFKILLTISLSISMPNILEIVSAILGHPILGFLFFISRTTSMISLDGPLGPDFFRFSFEEKSIRYFLFISSW